MPLSILVGALRLAVLPALLFGLWLMPAHAQTPPMGDGVKGWRVVTFSAVEYYPSPMQACERQHEVFNPGATFYGYKELSWGEKRCDWCYKTSGGCAFAQPTVTEFICASGYDRVEPGSCVEDGDPVGQDQVCSGSGGARNPATENPILILTGAKVLTATDFAAADGDLALERAYRSLGGPGFVDRAPRGLGLGWRFSFQHELAIDSSFVLSGRVTLKSADGATYDFVRQADGTMAAAYSGLFNSIRNADYQLAFEGPWPADLAQVPQTKTHWRLIDPKGQSWRLESFDQPGLSAAFDVARPVSLTRRDGYGQSFAYGPWNELQSLTDSFGRQIAFTWAYGVSYDGAAAVSFPAAVASATVPGGATIRYGYEPLSSADVIVRPERLSEVRQVDGEGRALESTRYHHEDARFPAHVTGITDGRGVRALSVTYDGRGRALSSALADGAEATSVAYGEAITPITIRTVTNALGKQAVYRFRATGLGAFRFEGVDGVASTNCAGSTTAVVSDANGWVVSETDQEGTVTTYTRDARGRPTSVTKTKP